jgi:group I intron endonuclease
MSICGIYKITNKINGHSYIGQSLNIEQRWTEHKKCINNTESWDRSLYKAIRKYGLDNFSWEIIEECSEENLDNRETYWIDYYNSYNDGYNQTMGGSGTHGNSLKITKEQVNEIRSLLKNTNLSNREIGEKYQLSETLVSAINTGYYWYDLNIKYPIRVPEGYFPYKGKNGVTYYRKISNYCKKCGKKIQNSIGLCSKCQKENN